MEHNCKDGVCRMPTEDEYTHEDALDDLGLEFDALVAYLVKKGVVNREEFDQFFEKYVEEQEED